MDELLNSFIAESSDMLDEMEEDLLALEQEFDKTRVDRVFRSIHTIKGNSGLFDLPLITNLAHHLETVLGKVRSGDIEIQSFMIDVFLAGNDLLRQALGAISGGAAPDTADLEDRLQRILAGENLEGMAPIQRSGGETVAATPATVAGSEKDSGVDPADTLVDATADVPAGSPAPAPPVTAPGVPVDPTRISESERKQYLHELKASVDPLEDAVVELETEFNKDRLKFLDLELEIMRQGAEAHAIESVADLAHHLRSGVELLRDGVFQLDMETADRLLVGLDRIRGLAEDPGQNVSDLTRAWEKLEGFRLANKKESAGRPATGAARPAPASPPPKPGPRQTPKPAPPAAKPASAKQTAKAAAPSASPAPVAAAAAKGSAEKKTDSSAPAEDKPADTHLRVPIELIDLVINLAGETVIARNDLIRKIEEMREPGLASSAKKISFLITRLQEGIMRTRMQHLQVVFSKIPRLVRDLERTTGKKVNLELEGGEVDMDKTLIDLIGDPLMHIVRNSMDHGLETVEERTNAGKSPTGHLRVHASMRGGNVLITIQDDGRGLNEERIKGRAIERGLITEEQAEAMPAEKIHELIFEPGFSTAEKVTTISGRGVGMDVVRSNVQKAGGNVEVFSKPGEGSRMRLILPQTLTIITCLILRAGSQRFALPQQNIDRLILFKEEKVARVEGQMMYQLKEHMIPLFNLEDILGIESSAPATGGVSASSRYIIVVRSEQHHYGLMAQEILNPEEIVIKPLGVYLQDLNWYSGAAIMGDGAAVLILDVPGIAREMTLASRRSEDELQEMHDKEEATHVETPESHVLFVKNGQRFAISAGERPRIIRMEQESRQKIDAWDVLLFQEEVVPLLRLEDYFRFKEIRGDNPEAFVIIFGQDGESMGLVADDILNVVPGLPPVDRTRVTHTLIVGTTLVDGKTTVVINSDNLYIRWKEKQGQIQPM